ncbi:MAG: PQQ-like beta-propeller repeat protein [Bryobacteraceae bacterium]|nr:PQQ-like beta-propeller repeat protein [Bryobacteraceae bacterium]
MKILRAPLVIALSALVLPPLGLILLLTRPATRWYVKAGASVLILGLGIAHLFLLYGLRVELDGSSKRPFLSFYDPETHYRQLEESRKQMAAKAVEEPVQAIPASQFAAAGADEPKPAEAPAPATVKETPKASKEAPAPVRGYWTDFRGPNRDGVYSEMPVLTEWPSEGLKPAWKQPVGGGYASFVAAGGRAFTIEQRRDREVVAAYDIETGRELWTNSWPAYFRESMGGDGPRATPTWHEGRVYALGAEGEFRVIDAESGKTIWRRNILEDAGASNLQWGMAASPLIVDDKVIVLPGGRSGKSVVAYHKKTGNVVWTSLDDKQAYASPMLVTLAGVRQVLVVTASRVVGLSPEDGKLLWEYPWVTSFDVNGTQPILVDGNRFIISSGYDHGAALIEIRSSGGGLEARKIWENKNMKNRFNSSVLYQGHIYGLDEGIFTCVEVETGQRKWKGGRYGYGQVLLAGDRLIVITETGDLVLIRPSPDRLQELARFEALEGKTWNNHAIENGFLLVRNATEMAAYRIAR